MPILKLSNREGKFVEIGRLRKGAPKPERGPGKDLDYFRFESTPEIMGIFESAYKDRPRAIRCYLPFDEIDMTFMAFQELWGKGGLVHRCDGEFLWEYDHFGVLRQTNKACPSKDLPDGDKLKCKQVGRLFIWIPELLEAGHVGYVTVLTTSIIDIQALYDELKAVYDMAGRLTGIEMILYRNKQLTHTGEGENRKSVWRWMLHIKPSAAFVKARLLAMHNHVMSLAGGAAPMLTAPMQQLPAPSDGRIIDHETGEIFDQDDQPYDEAQAVIDEPPAAAPAPAPQSKPKAASKPAPRTIQDQTPQPKNYNPQTMRAMRQKIDQLWIDEKKLGGEQPLDELGLDLEALSGMELARLGQKIQARIATLKESWDKLEQQDSNHQ